MMCKRVVCSVVFIALGFTQVGVSGDIPDLAAWWALDDGAGTTAVDSSGNGHDGVTFGDPAWVAGIHGGALEFDGADDRVEMPGTSLAEGFPCFEGEVSWAIWFKTPGGARGTLIAQDPPGGAHVSGNRQLNVEDTGFLRIRANSVGPLNSYNSSMAVNDDEWHHAAVTIAFEPIGTNDSMKVYIDGDLSSGYELDTVDINGRMAASTDFVFMLGYNAGAPFLGSIDDVAVFGRALSADEVLQVMAGRSVELASGASPGDGATDVLRDTVLTWNAGEFAAEHDVYVGMAFGDVNDATTNDAAYQGRQDQTSFDPGILALGETYFWRVDEVNAAPDSTVFKGDTWRFTVEPVSYALPIGAVSVTASSMTDSQDPNNTVNGSGLDENDAHSDLIQDMWISAMDDAEPSIEFEFETLQKLDKVLVWNHNSQSEAILGFGTREALIAYSQDGETWSELGTVEIAQASGGVGYTGVEVPLDGIVARIVKVTCLSNWSILPAVTQKGLSEVRFFAVPVYAREPQPDDGVTTSGTDITLQWRPGRQAVSHDVLLSSDPGAIQDGSAVIGTSGENQYQTDPLDYATTYYWQIIEVNEAAAPTAYPGDVWSFTTPGYAVIDDFEKYADQEFLEIWAFWADGFDDPDNGSLVGIGNIGERTIVHGGSQSMPVQFNNNTTAVAEVTLSLDSQNWGASNIQSLSLFVHGDVDNTGQLYLKINDTQIDYAGLPDVLQRAQWVSWHVDLAGSGADVADVTSLTIGVQGAGATGMVYVDDIRLYPLMPETIEPVIPDDSDPNLVAYYEFEGNADDRQGNYPGTAEGDPLYTDGKVGQALSLDNVDDHIVNTFDQEAVWPAYSVTLWVKTDLFNQDIYSSLFNNNSNGPDFQIEVNGSDNYLYRGTGNGILGPVSSDWVHLAVSCDGVQTRLYYNGLHTGTVNEANATFGQLAVGINRGMSNRFGGTLDDVRVYDRALTSAEAAGLAGLTGSVPLPF